MTTNGDTNVVNEIYKRDGQGVAFIEADARRAANPSPFNPFGEPEGGGGTATGSGFVIDNEGHILTNNHVVEGADARSRSSSAPPTQPTTAKVVGADPATDVALLKVDAPADELHPLPLGDSSKVEVGDPVVAIGNPFGLDRTVTTGIVSALQRQIEAPNGFSISHVIQTDAAINPGNSGGPLIDAEGRVIGINSQIETGGGGDGNVGIGFAVPINTAAKSPTRSRRTARSSTPTSASAAAAITPTLAKASTCRSTRACWSARRQGRPGRRRRASRAATPKRRSKAPSVTPRRRHHHRDRRQEGQSMEEVIAPSTPRSPATRSK